ncbi:MAG: hypothetical protein K0R19_1379 [Bacillota bacterium]|nr:hypothetical protein [Bacillota bacterium]
MKKLMVLIMTLVITLSLAACGGSGDSEEPAQDASAPQTSDVTLVSKEANFTALLVPSDFAEFQTVDDGSAIAEGPNSNIVVTNTNETDVTIEDMTKDYLVGLMGNSYSNIEVLAFENPVTIAGVNAALIQFTGDGVTSGKNKTVCYILLFFSLEGLNCEQHVALTYDTGANTSLEANLSEIIESITLN